MVSVGVRVHRKDFVFHPKRRLAPGLHFMGFWKGKGELAAPGQGITRHEIMVSRQTLVRQPSPLEACSALA